LPPGLWNVVDAFTLAAASARNCDDISIVTHKHIGGIFRRPLKCQTKSYISKILASDWLDK
jgi:hypothetical protein